MKPRMIEQAAILVGGRGTRLGSLTGSTPKPMLPVAGRPFLEYVVAWLRGQGVRQVVFCAGYLAEIVEQHFGDGRHHGVQISYSVEPEPGGTGGGLLLAKARLEEMFFALNGDTLFDVDLSVLAGLLVTHPEARACLALREVENVGRYGSIESDGHWVTRFAEKNRAGRGWINGGIYCLRRSVLDDLPPAPCALEKDLFPGLAAQRRMMSYPFSGYFIDIGLPETLARAQDELPRWEKAAGYLPVKI